MKTDKHLPQVPRVAAASISAHLRAKARQAGLSLVELMVAVTIGLFLLLVVANLFIGSKQTYTNQDNLSRLQENGRFAIALMGKAVREAGFHYLSFNPQPNYYGVPTATSPAWPYTTVAVVGGTEGGTSPDTITLAEDNSVDCLNAAVTSPAQNQYSINASAQLICTSLANASTTGVLLDGVEDMQVLYGEDLGSSYRYVPANTAGVNWGNVNAVRICMLLRTTAGGLTVTAQHYTDCNGNTNVTATDGRIREAFSETFTIRSRIP